jgi:methylthioribose-1-phosphate isomerase
LVVTVDQTKLPEKFVYLKLKTPKEIAEAIKNMKIRGAPLLGAAAALGLAQTAYKSKPKTKKDLLEKLEKTSKLIKSTRPTAVNLFNSIDLVLDEAKKYEGAVKEFKDFVVKKCLEIVDMDAQINRMLSLKGAELIVDGDKILTHCNAGELATVQYGTALGVIKAAFRQGKKIQVVATETRPLLQGARLTAFELKKEKIPFILITDNMVGWVMQKGMISKVVVGADRILMSGHVINKIGTYSIAVLAKHHGIPFYVAAPISTIDQKSRVEEVIIEERKPEEILRFCGCKVAPKNTKVYNPAFDITPPELITGIITEKGVIKPTSEELNKVLAV